MAYYLGYKKNGDYVPINLNLKNMFDILSIVEFTCKFENEWVLKEYLIDSSLIPSEDVELSYLIDKGKKGYKTYCELPNIKRVFYREHASSFNLNRIKMYLEENYSDQILFRSLLASLLKKYGITEDLKNFIYDNLKDANGRKIVISLFNSIRENSSIIQLNYLLQKAIETLDADESTINVSIYNLISYIHNNDDSLIFVYNWISKKINTPRRKEIDDLLTLLQHLNNCYPIKSNIIIIIEKFLRHYLVTDDNKTNSRNLVDLGSSIQEYKDYKFEIELLNYKKISTSEDSMCDEMDEFLEEEDFARHDTTSENAGIRLRQSDSSLWKPGK